MILKKMCSTHVAVVRFLALAGALLLAMPSHAASFGFGGNATGGAGKPVFLVTSLVDSPSDGLCDRHCSLRDALAACKAAGGGIIHFTGLSGHINIGTGGSNIVWDCPNSTIDGSTAANQGVQILGGPGIAASNQFLVDADNVIVRYMRFRCTHYSGDPRAPGCTGGIRDIFAILGGHDIWVDHCSFAWATDSMGDIGDGSRAATDVTYSNNLFAESLTGKTILIASGATRISFYRNAFINSAGRLPAIQPTSVAFGVDVVIVELVENYWYNFSMAVQHWAGTPDLLVESSTVGNVFQMGPAGDPHERIPLLYRNENLGRIWIYNSGNRLLDGGQKWSDFGAAGRACDAAAAEATFWQACTWPKTALADCDERLEAPCGAVSDKPFQMASSYRSAPATPKAPTNLTVDGVGDASGDLPGALELKQAILATVGASLPCRDALDAEMVADANSNGAAGPLFPLKAPTGSLPDLTAACH